MNEQLLVRRCALGAGLGFVGLGVFQLVFAAGAPQGQAACGGTEAHSSPALRVGSACSAIFYALATAVILRRASYGVRWVSEKLARRGTWALVVILSLSTFANLMSQSPWERFLLGPTGLVFPGSASRLPVSNGLRIPANADRDALHSAAGRATQ